jgi:hypothetical protein
LSAFDELHAEVAGTLALADFINGNDAGMIQPGGGFSFQTEAFHMRLRGPLAKTDDFQCDRSMETLLPRTVNHALTAPAEFLQQFIVAEIHQHVGRMTGIIDHGDVFVCERTEACL